MPFDPSTAKPVGHVDTSIFDPSTATPVKPSGFIRRVADQGIKLAQGVVGVPEAAVGVADLVTGGQAGKLAESAGVRFKDAKDILGDYLSPEQKAADAEVQKAEGFLPTLGAMAKNPSTIIGSAVESAPSMLLGGAASRGLLAVAPRLGAVAAGAAGEGITAAGQNAEQVRQEDPNGTLTGQQSAILAGSGLLTGGISLASGKVANKLGIGDVQTMLANGKLGVVGEDAAQTAAKKGITRKLAEGFANEGVLQELPQSYQEQVAQNVAQGKPWDEGAAKAGAQGMMAGALMGGGANAASHFSQNETPAVTPTPAADVVSAPAPLQIGNTPDPYISFTDGTVARQSEADAYIKALPTEQQPAARAKIMGLAPQPSIPEAVPITEIGIPTTETVAAPVKSSEAMGLNPAAGPLSAAAVTAVDTGVHQEIALNKANASDQAAYEQATNTQAQQAAEQDTTDKPITHGPIAEAAMSTEDKQAILFSNKAVADGGTQYAGTKDGDILNGLGKPYPTWQTAMRRAKMEGKDWSIAPVADGFVARQTEGKASAQPAAGASGNSSTQEPIEAVAENSLNQYQALVQQAQSATNSIATTKENTSVNQTPVAFETTPKGPKTPDQAAEVAQASEHIGRDNRPLSKGGKPFKTRDAATEAKKLQPMLRVVKSGKGFALAPKTEKQLAAEVKAAKRLGNPQTSPRGEPIPAHAFIAAEGGMHAGTKSDMNIGINPRVGNRNLFAGKDKGLSMERATARLIEEGYLQEGASHNDAAALIKRSLTKPQYTATGTEMAAQADIEVRFDDYLAAEQEAVRADGFDPFGPLADHELLTEEGYDQASPELQAEFRALISLAEAGDVDAESIQMDVAAQVGSAATDRDYHEAAITALKAAIEGGVGNGRSVSGGQSQTPAGQDASTAEGLTAPSRAGILAQQNRTDNSAALDDKAQIDAEASRQTLTSQAAPEQRKDTSGDMFAMEKAQAESDQRNDGVRAAKDPNQGSMFDEPAASPVSKTETTAKAPKTPSAAELRAQADLQAALADLGDIFGKSTRLNMMPEQEAKILPVMVKLLDAAFRLGYIKFKDAAKFALDKIRAALGNEVADDITLEHLQGAYISMSSGKTSVDGIRAVSTIEAKSEIEQHTAQTDNERNGESNAASTNSRVERNRQEPATEPAVGDPIPAEPAGVDQAATKTGGRADRGDGRGQQDGAGVPFGSAPVAGERGDQRLRTGVAEPELTDIVAGADFREPGGDSGISGVPPESIPASQVAAAADQGDAGLKAGIEQARANKAPLKLGDIDSIRATLPQLLPGQQDDVLMTEQRFAEPKGYGMLFTNGTGTGKTFTGLGAIKRHVLQGKSNILIAAPDDKIASDWMESGKLMGLDISKLADTQDAGKGIVITTYANLGENDQLATRQWDMVVADEAHSLMQAADGKPTGYLHAVRALTYHPDGAGARHNMLNRDKLNRSSELREKISANNSIINNQDTMDVMVRSLGAENTKLHAEEVKLNAELNASRDAMKAEVAAKQGASRPRLLALSATPFAYEKTIDWANGYLFEYTDGYPYNENSTVYNQPDPREYYFQTRFGYTMRYNKLTQPDGKIDSGMLQRQWNGELKKAGALSGRMLDVVPDYDRRFVLVDSAIGNRIDEALAWLTEQRLAAAKGDDGFAMLGNAINDKFKYLEKRYLLEAIKATEVIPIVKQHMAMGRKVVVFHDYKKGGGFNPFRVAAGTPANASADNVATVKSFNAAVSVFNDKFRDLVNAPLGSMPSPIDVFSRELPEVLLINGDQKKADLLARYKSFQDDATGPQVMLVQSAKNKGWSGHDTTGKHQRVLINLGQPTAPTLAIQQEGRIYRTGQASDAIMRYLNTGTNWERWTFASTIASRASTAENLGMGEMARALKDSFIQSFEESDAYPPGHDQEGKGGKERDKAANNSITEYDRAKTHYWAMQKKNSRTKAQEGADYFATPEPLGLKMVQWLDARPGEDMLEPSGGHGAIARWLPEKTNKTVIEPSMALRSRLAMVMNVAEDRIIDGTFEEHAVVNKYDGIVMNPPFGTAGRTAVDHIAKAATHLRDGGRIVALLPTGPVADKKFDKWFFETSEKAAKPLGISHKHGPIYKGDTVTIGGFGRPQTFVVEHVDGPVTGPQYVRPKGIHKDAGVNIVAIESITPGDQRTESYSPSEGLQLVATIKLPQVTFERAGTAVATRIVVIEKTNANVMQRDRDLSDITDINELFDLLEDMDFPARPKVDAVAAEEPAKAEKPAKTRKQAAPQTEVGDSITLGDKSYPVATYTTNAGKELRGVWAVSKAEALNYGPSTFEKKGLGFFVRERDFPKVDAPDAPALSRNRPVFSRGAQTQATQSVSSIVDAIKSRWANAPKIIVAFDMQDDLIPERIRQEDLKQRSGGAAGTPEGFYYDGKVYLMSSQLNTSNDVARVLFHETLGHFGLRGHFGGALKPILQQIVTFRRDQVDAKIKEYGLRSVNNLDRMTAAEEVLAEMAQNTPSLGFVKRAIAAIRNWLRANVPGFQSMKMTDADIVQQFILPARRFVERGGNIPAPSGPHGRTTTQPAFNRGTNEAMTNPNDVVGNQGGRSADDSTPGAAKKKALLTQSEFDAAVAFVKEVEALAEKHGAVYVRWSASEKHDLSADAKSRDYGSGEVHSGLSSQKIDADMHPVTIARRIAEYGFSRGFGKTESYPRIYTADEVGTDSDNAVSITNLKKVIDVPKSFVAAIDKRFHDAYDYQDSLKTWSKRGNAEMVQKYTGALDSVLANESTAPDSGGAMFSRTKIIGQTARQHTPEQLRAMANVGFQVEVPTLKERAQVIWKDAGKKMAQGIVDQFAPVKALDGTAYGLLRLAKGASGAFESFLHGGQLKLTDGVYDFDEKNKGGVVEKLLIPLQGEHHDFMRWVAANRAERLQGEGKENLFSLQDIADLKTLASGTAAFYYKIQNGPRAGTVTRDRAVIYADSLKTFNQFNKNILDMAEQSGLIDGASRQVWEHEFYVPFYRVADEDGGGVRGMNIKGSVVRQQAFKELKGGKNALNTDLLDNTLMNWAHLLDAAAKNRAAKATIEAAERLGIAAGGNQSTLQQMGASINNKNGVVWFMDGGQKRYSLIDKQGDGPFLMTALGALEYSGMRNPMMNAMSAMKHVLTVGVTASPFFKVRNLIRDSVQVIGTSGINKNGFSNVAQGWKLTDPKSDAYFRLLAGGGTIHFGTMMEGSESKRIQSLVESGVDDATILGDQHKVKAFYRKFIEPSITAYNELGNRGEAINRAALYDQLVKQGVSHADASLQARDLMDFSMQGSFTTIRFLTQVVPFLNARLQGLYKLGRAAKEDPARFSVVLGVTAMFSIALLAAYGDDDDWKKREEWDRNNFWWFKFGGTAFRIPKPFEIGAIATLAERGFELAFDKEMTGTRFRNQVATLLGDNLSMNPVPQLVKPILDVYANKDSFSGRPIETMGMDRLQSEYRFTDRTSMTARALSTAANSVTGLVGAESLSPVQIDSMLRGYFGWLGSFVVGAADVLARPATDQPGHAAPDYWKTATGSIVSDLRDAPSRYVSQMYAQAREIEQAYGTWKSLQKEGKTQEAAEFAQDNRDKLAKYRMVEHIKKQESSANQRVRMIERSAMDGERKRELIRNIQEQKDRIARPIAI